MNKLLKGGRERERVVFPSPPRRDGGETCWTSSLSVLLLDPHRPAVEGATCRRASRGQDLLEAGGGAEGKMSKMPGRCDLRRRERRQEAF